MISTLSPTERETLGYPADSRLATVALVNRAVAGVAHQFDMDDGEKLVFLFKATKNFVFRSGYIRLSIVSGFSNIIVGLSKRAIILKDMAAVEDYQIIDEVVHRYSDIPDSAWIGEAGSLYALEIAAVGGPVTINGVRGLLDVTKVADQGFATDVLVKSISADGVVTTLNGNVTLPTLEAFVRQYDSTPAVYLEPGVALQGTAVNDVDAASPISNSYSTIEEVSDYLKSLVSPDDGLYKIWSVMTDDQRVRLMELSADFLDTNFIFWGLPLSKYQRLSFPRTGIRSWEGKKNAAGIIPPVLIEAQGLLVAAFLRKDPHSQSTAVSGSSGSDVHGGDSTGSSTDSSTTTTAGKVSRVQVDKLSVDLETESGTKTTKGTTTNEAFKSASSRVSASKDFELEIGLPQKAIITSLLRDVGQPVGA